MDLVERIKKAIKKHNSEGVEGWGIQCPEPLAHLFTEVETGFHGCASQTCRCESHDPGAYTIKLVHNSTKCVLTELGYDYDSDEQVSTFYHVQEGDTEHYLELVEPRAYHAYVRLIDPDCIPNFILAKFIDRNI
jgi:hypothetical protein